MKPGDRVRLRRDLILKHLVGAEVPVRYACEGIVQYESEGAFGVAWLLDGETVTIEVTEEHLELLTLPYVRGEEIMFLASVRAQRWSVGTVVYCSEDTVTVARAGIRYVIPLERTKHRLSVTVDRKAVSSEPDQKQSGSIELLHEGGSGGVSRVRS